MLKVITVTNNIEATQPLIRSLDKFGWKTDVLVCEWKGFGTKLIETYNHLKAHPEIDRFIFCDAFDVVALSGPDEFEKKHNIWTSMLISTEKNLWPPYLTPFKMAYHGYGEFLYPNSGLYYAPAELFIKLFERYPPNYDTDDQFWMNMVWLIHNAKYDLWRDFSQEIFNSHSFIKEGEYTYENNRVQILGNQPIFIHSNARTVDEKFNEMIKI